MSISPADASRMTLTRGSESSEKMKTTRRRRSSHKKSFVQLVPVLVCVFNEWKKLIRTSLKKLKKTDSRSISLFALLQVRDFNQALLDEETSPPSYRWAKYSKDLLPLLCSVRLLTGSALWPRAFSNNDLGKKLTGLTLLATPWLFSLAIPESDQDFSVSWTISHMKRWNLEVLFQKAVGRLRHESDLFSIALKCPRLKMYVLYKSPTAFKAR